MFYFYLFHFFKGQLLVFILEPCCLARDSIFPAPVSGTCVMQIWDRIRLVPDSGAD